MGARRVVEAAGGVVWRRGATGEVEVLVAHRPLYDDWTFPKGKVDPTDADLGATAHREVWEETGFHCARGHELITVSYALDDRRDKRVTYWEMTVEAGAFTPNDEVDAVRWAGVATAEGLLTHDGDRRVLAAFVTWASGIGQM